MSSLKAVFFLFVFALTGCVGPQNEASGLQAGTREVQPRVAPTIAHALTFAQPNIVFYLADDQDVTDYGAYGNEKVHTPGVDRLAREGIVRATSLLSGQKPMQPGSLLAPQNGASIARGSLDSS